PVMPMWPRIRTRPQLQTSSLPPIYRRPGNIPAAGAEVVVVAGAFRRQLRTRCGHGRARTVDGHGNGAAGKVRHAPTIDGVLRPETVRSRRVEIARLTAGYDG